MSRQWSTQTKVAAITAAGVVLAACITAVVSLITATGDKTPPGTQPAVASTVSSPVCLLGTWEMAEGGRRLNFQPLPLERRYELNYTCTTDALTLRWASSTEFAQYYRR